MKKRYCHKLAVIPLLLLCLPARAQIKLMQVEDFEPGHKMIYREVEGSIDPGKEGANVTWDFTTLSLKPDSTVVEIVAIPEQYRQLFPQANSIEQKSDSTAIIVDKQQAKSQLWGVIYKGITTTYSKPYTFIKRPFFFGDSVVSEPVRSYKAYGDYSGSGHTKTIADSWGKLLLPNGTYDVLRVRFEQQYTDVANGSAMNMNIITYAWFDNKHKGALLKITRTQISSTYYNNTFEQTEYLVSEK